MPKVSIILSVYNGERSICRSIESVLSQSFSEFEFIILDDGSVDGTIPVVESFATKDSRIIFLKNEKNIGIQRSVNRGLRVAGGEYIGRIDHDDFWLDENKLAKQVRFLDEHPDYVVVGTGTVMFDELGRELFRFLGKEEDLAIRRTILKKDPFTNSSTLIRKKSILDVGGYNESKDALHVEDYDLWLMLGKIGKFANLQDYATGFTMRAGSISSVNKRAQFKRSLKLIEKYGDYYPGKYTALIYAYFKLVGYYVYKLAPNFLKIKIFSLYKKI